MYFSEAILLWFELLSVISKFSDDKLLVAYTYFAVSLFKATNFRNIQTTGPRRILSAMHLEAHSLLYFCLDEFGISIRWLMTIIDQLLLLKSMPTNMVVKLVPTENTIANIPKVLVQGLFTRPTRHYIRSIHVNFVESLLHELNKLYVILNVILASRCRMTQTIRNFRRKFKASTNRAKLCRYQA
ncbi:hypothetical protein BDF21DRAFT_402931 [Thamnidium elegans]|nr:hypothetical protein BDF21DRAFT_402931 [Thamnidium elegans]